ncbi:ribosomal protein L17, putative [Eimeria brunetti]|uniref:Ribosomal protein L17, putative n=1 Tax=Eimeria brunetti TaxID=51314 RepID=U6LIK4_9EIME|nr:ribosomal protein L17, putative [Eimeria brunetti]
MKKQPHQRWDAIRNQLDQLLRFGRLETTIARAKELQPYAEELIHLAKRPEKASAVESILRTPAARRRLFEELLGVYRQRNFFFTRVLNQFRLRMRDAAPMAYIEFVDRPGELRPAQPVGLERQKYIWDCMHQSRRQRRLLWNHALKIGVSDASGCLLKPHLPNLFGKGDKKETVEKETVEKETVGEETAEEAEKGEKETLKTPKKGDKKETPRARCMDNDFFIDLSPPNFRERRARARPKKFYP